MNKHTYTYAKYLSSFMMSVAFVLSGGVQAFALDFQQGFGTENAPYIINTGEELNRLRKYTGVSNENIFFALGQDIDLTTFLTDSPDGWEPIGRVPENGFYGKLNGNNHAISGLFINKQDSINIGLFGYVSRSAVIKDITVITDERGVCSKYGQSGILIGCLGLEGEPSGEITGCTVSGIMKELSGSNVWTIGGMIGRNNGYVHHCHAKDILVYGYGQVGALIGVNAPYRDLHDCSVSGVIHAGWSNIGGLIGKNLHVANPRNIYDCHVQIVIHNNNRGYMGGFIGQNVSEGDIYNCSVVGDINGNNDEIGGFVGRNSGGDSGAASPIYSGGVIRNCWFAGTVTARKNAGGFAGRNYKRIVNCFAIAVVNVSEGYSGGFTGNNYHEIDSCYFSGYISWAGAGALGGFLGRNYDEPVNNKGGTVANSYCAAHVMKRAGASDTYIGKFFGGQTTPLSSGAVVDGKAIWDCFYNLDVSGYPNTQGIIPANQAGATTTALSASAMRKAANFTSLNFNNQTWKIWEGKTSPYFSWQTTPMSIAAITNTNIQAESKEILEANDSLALFVNGKAVKIENSVKNGSNWTGSFADGTIYDGTVLMLVRFTKGLAPAASVVIYESESNGFVAAQDLTIIGQATPLASFHRINTTDYPDLTANVKNLLKNGAGIGVMFKTSSTMIQVRWSTGLTSNRNYVNPILEKGLDLYIKKNGHWVWAGVAQKSTSTVTIATIVKNMDNTEKECILYLPIYEEVTSLKIGVDPDSYLSPIISPFKGKVVMYGTSIMQGASASRPGMAYPSRLSRATGINFINIGLSGNGTMPKADADMIATLEADAYIMDCTQNGSVTSIRSNTAYMVKKIRELHPDAPIIMKAGETRITGNFDEVRKTYWGNVYAAFKQEYENLATGDNPVQNLYFIDDTGFLGDDQEAVVDGAHPTDVGFTRMLNILQPKLMEILGELPVFKQ